jgi:hypothetical protein
MSEGRKLPDDEWHTHVYVHFSWLECAGCGVETPKLDWAWEGTASGEPGVAEFTIRAVRFLKNVGWRCENGALWCPACADIEFRRNLQAPESK